jgi:hypothetical protein
VRAARSTGPSQLNSCPVRRIEKTMPLYAAGPCSVCAHLGDAVFVRCVRSGRFFYACWSCGIAWLEPPVAYRVDALTDPLEIAPDGWTVATFDEISKAGLASSVHHELSGSADSLVADVSGYRVSG